MIKQDKELFIIARTTTGSAAVEVKHEFVEAGSKLDMFDFIFMFED